MSLINLEDVKNTAEALTHTPTGAAVAEASVALGLVSRETLANPHDRRPMVQNLSSLTAQQLSDENGYWVYESARVSEQLGLLSGQEQVLKLRADRARAKARSRVRRDAEAAIAAAAAAFEAGTGPKPTLKMPSEARIADEAETDPGVIDADEHLETTQALMKMAKVAEKVIDRYLTVLSREITLRTSQMDARIY